MYGPGVKLLPRNLQEMGIAYAMYRAVTDIEKTASMACDPVKDSKPSRVEDMATNQTV